MKDSGVLNTESVACCTRYGVRVFRLPGGGYKALTPNGVGIRVVV